MSQMDDVTTNGDMEDLLAGIWQDVLGRDDISSDRDFFEMGGDSLQLMTMLFRIYQDTGVELDPGTVFEGPTVARLAAVVAERQQSQVATAEGPEGTI